jgi:hypothetical protein
MTIVSQLSRTREEGHPNVIINNLTDYQQCFQNGFWRRERQIRAG